MVTFCDCFADVVRARCSDDGYEGELHPACKLEWKSGLAVKVTIGPFGSGWVDVDVAKPGEDLVQDALVFALGELLHSEAKEDPVAHVLGGVVDSRELTYPGNDLGLLGTVVLVLISLFFILRILIERLGSLDRAGIICLAHHGVVVRLASFFHDLLHWGGGETTFGQFSGE